MNLNLHDLYNFVQVIDHGGFAPAARVLGVSKSNLSRRIAGFEALVGVRLIERSTRNFAVSEVGREVYRYAAQAVVAAATAERLVKRCSDEPAGIIKFICPTFLAQRVLRELVPQFAIEFPKVCLVEHVSNVEVDVLGESYDLALRVHGSQLPDSSVIQRRLALAPLWLVASPAYVRRAGSAHVPEDLFEHDGLVDGDYTPKPVWTLLNRAGGVAPPVPFIARTFSNDMMTLLALATAGLGIVALPAQLAREHLKRGLLVRVLSEWTAGHASISALIPGRRHQSAALRLFVDFLASRLPGAMQAPGEVGSGGAPNCAGDGRQAPDAQ